MTLPSPLPKQPSFYGLTQFHLPLMLVLRILCDICNLEESFSEKANGLSYFTSQSHSWLHQLPAELLLRTIVLTYSTFTFVHQRSMSELKTAKKSIIMASKSNLWEAQVLRPTIFGNQKKKKKDPSCLMIFFVLPNEIPLELFYDRGNHYEFRTIQQELAMPGELRNTTTFNFEFKNVEKQYESYHGINVKLR